MRQPDPVKREKILNAAIGLFVKNGYNDTTTLAISQRINMSSSRMYTYFEDKEHLLVEAVLRMKDEHTALSTELAKKSAGLDDERFIALFYEAQAAIYHRVRFIMGCILTPGLAPLFTGIDFDFSEVFLPYLKGWPDDLAGHTARALASIAAGYFLIGNADEAKASSFSVLQGARALMADGVG